jgi:glutamine amidotransferase
MISNTKKVVIIDYQLGNLFSVLQACEEVGIHAFVSSEIEDIKNAEGIILPGVGAFSEAMKNLRNLNIINVLKDQVKKEIPIFGICLGQQLLFTESEEFNAGSGLDLVPGIIKKFPDVYDGKLLKVPHISWNTISSNLNSFKDTPLRDLKDGDFMYFVHSFFAVPDNDEFVLSVTNYSGIEFCSSILMNNIFATQFHPEKSAEKGLSIYKNWATINNLI